MHFNWHHLEVAPDIATDTPVEVKTETVDSICHRLNAVPDVVKIDVEGYEKHVLEGAPETLRAAKLLFLEIHPDPLFKLRIPQRDIYRILIAQNWTVKGLAGQLIEGRDFEKRFHTFWVFCERK